MCISTFGAMQKNPHSNETPEMISTDSLDVNWKFLQNQGSI